MAAALSLAAPTAYSGPATSAVTTETAPPIEPAAAGFDLSGEYDASDAYIGDAQVRRDGRDTTLDQHNSLARFVLTPRVGLGYLRVGAEWERYSFGLSEQAPLPNTLQAVDLIVGLDTKFSDSILLRLEAHPGFYGSFFDHVRPGDFNVPFIVGGTYIVNDDLQVIGGVSVQVDRKYPVLPGVGVRWKFAPHLVLDAVLPTPRLEYEYSRTLTAYAGAEVKDETYRVGEHFGDTHGDGRLNHAILTYSEVRVGGGVAWQLAPGVTLSGEGGCQPYREFDYYRADARYRAEGSAPYGVISLHGAF